MVYYMDKSNGISDQLLTGEAAFLAVRNHIASLPDSQSTDLIFLKTLMESPMMTNLVKLQDRLEEKVIDLCPEGRENAHLISDICQRYDRSYKRDAKELVGLLRSLHIKALIQAHDQIAEEYFEGKEKSLDNLTSTSNSALSSPWEEIKIFREKELSPEAPIAEMEEDPANNVVYTQPIRIIGLRKSPGQPLGLTVEEEGENLVIARILSGGLIDRLGLLKVGEVILEVNGVTVSSPDQLQQEIVKARDQLQIKVGSPVEDRSGSLSRQVVAPKEKQKTNLLTTFEGQKTRCFIRALFGYDPNLDTLVPCKEIGLQFQTGDILQVLDQSDPNWWQAKKVGENVVGLIPSRELEERRAAFVRPEADFVHSIGICGTRIARKKKKVAYNQKQNFEYDKAELILYEEVTRIPPIRRNTLILIGTGGVGRRTLKNRLINSDSNKFGGVLPMTSRPPRTGEEQMNLYIFVSKEYFEDGIKSNMFLEFGEKDGHYYGTTFDSVREIIRSGKMCILDVSPTVLKILHNSSEFTPYVCFLASPGAEGVRQQEEFERQHGYSSRTLTFDRMNSMRYSSRRARTLESIASLYEEDDMRQSVEESQRIQRTYEPYFDLIVINEDFDQTFRRVVQALDSLYSDHSWVPNSWIY